MAPSSSDASAAALDPNACGELECRLYDTPEDAFRAILATKPMVVAVGEAHAQKGTEGIDSSAKRFTARILPVLEGRASDLLVELMAPAAGCKAKVEAVREKQKQVTAPQADTNQNEYVLMGNAAKARGIVPDMLRPSCDDLAAIDDAGADAIAASLSTIARLTTKKSESLVDRNRKLDPDKIVVTYGGAMHNDREPPPESAGWSFGADVAKYVGGKYVEIDMFVPEFIQDTDTWKKQDWYAHFDKNRAPTKTTLFNPKPGQYVLIYPATPK
ncbi:MAG: hypothetical protein ABIP39_14465 [Polyangiaceae bacterium]